MIWLAWVVALAVAAFAISMVFANPRDWWPALFVLLLDAAVLACLIVAHDREPLSPSKAFQALYTLTPSELQRRCGPPSQIVTDVLTKDDGIMDLYYGKDDDSEVVFRFTRSSHGDIDSLGAWRGVHAPTPGTAVSPPHDLGDPIDSRMAISFMPCLRNASSTADAPYRPIDSGLSLGLVPAAMILGQMEHPTDRPIDHGIHTLTNGTTTASGNGINGGLGETGSGSGGGGPPDDQPLPSSVVIPCPPGSDFCTLLDSGEFLAGLRQTLTAAENNNYEQVNEWLNDMTGKKIVIIQLPDLLVNRQAAIKEIFRLQIQINNAVAAHLRADVARLTPFRRDTPEEQQQRLDVVMEDDQHRVQSWKATAEEARPVKSMSTVSVSERPDSSSHDYHVRFSAEAYRQLIHVDLTKSWGSH